MKITQTNNVNQNNYSVKFESKSISPEFQELLNDFAEPVISVGGVIPIDASTSFTLGNETRKIPSQLPLEKVFTKAQYGENAQPYAEAYAEEIDTRIKTAIDALKLKVDTFTSVNEIDY